MKKILLYTSFIIILGIIKVTAQTDDNKCSIMRDGTFFYGKKEDKMIIINGSIVTEYFRGYTIKGKLVWVNECEYNRTITSVKLPSYLKKKKNIDWSRNDRDFYVPERIERKYRNHIFSVGDVLNVKINRIIENEIFYTASRNGKSWEGKVIKKIKEKGNKKTGHNSVYKT
ncbi:hypothetical protein LV716_13860 [Flagellimonas sp. HMM57]|uniref:hypothetical protein n=1 Tax=unclassified Flagellimonas TaxID=2644544 RepID=UPI0013D694C5|nr:MULTISPECIES: hypothetical protein [unclassified Flagellimonas]UII75333.1 hypothetical protein LV716_13860 [Flagellimonas sp. HMM57]